jgi:hypothetical protein
MTDPAHDAKPDTDHDPDLDHPNSHNAASPAGNSNPPGKPASGFSNNPFAGLDVNPE